MIRPAMNASRDNGVFSYRVSVLYNLFNLAVIPVLTGSFALDPHNLCVSLDCILSLHKKKISRAQKSVLADHLISRVCLGRKFCI